jgi:hypothetical protein
MVQSWSTPHVQSRLIINSTYGHVSDMRSTKRPFSRGLRVRHLTFRQIQPIGYSYNNADPHTESGSHWLAIRIEPIFFTSYFVSYGLLPQVPAI